MNTVETVILVICGTVLFAISILGMTCRGTSTADCARMCPQGVQSFTEAAGSAPASCVCK